MPSWQLYGPLHDGESRAYRFTKRWKGVYNVILTVRAWPHDENVIGQVWKNPDGWGLTPKLNLNEDAWIGFKTRRLAAEKLIDIYEGRCNEVSGV
jgi:hypothetical protein